MDNYYEILGIGINASEKEIKSAYRAKLNEYKDNEEQRQYITDAFEILNNKEKKREHDTYLIHGEEINNLSDNAENAMENENYKKAIQYFKKILDIQDSLKDIKRRLALAYSKDGQYNMALSQIKELISMDEDYIYFIDMGYIYGFLGDLKKQEASFTQAHYLGNNYDTMNILADFYKDNGNYEKAISFIDSCIKNDPENPFKDFSYLIKKILVYMQWRNIDGVKKTIEHIKKITPQSKNEDVSYKFNELIDNAKDLENFDLLEILSESALYFNRENEHAADELNKLRNNNNTSDDEDMIDENVYSENQEEKIYRRNEESGDDSYKQKLKDNQFISNGNGRFNKNDFIIEGLICAILGTVFFYWTSGLLLWLFAYLPLRRKHNIEKHNKYNIPKLSILQKIIGYLIIIFTVGFVTEDKGSSSLMLWVFIGFILGYGLFCGFLYLCPYLGINNLGTGIEKKLGMTLKSVTYKIIPFIKDNRAIVEEKLERIKDKSENLDEKANEYIEDIKGELKDRSDSIKGAFPLKKAALILGCICLVIIVILASIFGAVKLINIDNKDSEASLNLSDSSMLMDFNISCDKEIKLVGDTANIIVDSVYPDSIDKKKIDLYISSANSNIISVSDRKITAVGSGRCDVVVSSGNIQKTLSFNIAEERNDLNKDNYLREKSVREKQNNDSNINNSFEAYKNPRFGYSISYPSILQNIQKSDNGDGIRMSNYDNTIFMSAYGLNNVSNESATLRFNSLINNSRGANIEYKYNNGNKYVISWTDGQGMEYYRCEVVGKGSINGFIVGYPQSEGDYMSSIIEKIYKSFETPNVNKSW